MVTRGLPRTLLLPVETTNREFDGKLLLALKALDLGYDPIIGNKTAMHAVLPSLPKSIYLAKGARCASARTVSLLEALGHVIVALDEEALVRQPDDVFHMKLDPVTFNIPRLLYAWGKSNADVWRSFKDYGGAPILEVGNLRLDMLRPGIREFYRKDCEALRREHGRFVLLSSNFAFVNHFIPGHVRHRVAKTANKAKSEAFKSGFAEHKRALFAYFLALVPQLAAAIAPHILLIRPHPSENAAAWHGAAAGLKNVKVLHEGPMTPWLMAADLLIHNGCTSAIEASILGTPVFAYCPLQSGYDLELPNSLSDVFREAEALVETCQLRLSQPFAHFEGPTPQQCNVLDRHIESLDGPLTADRILSSFDEFHSLLVKQGVVSLSAKLGPLWQHYLGKAYRMVSTRIKTSRSRRDYTKHKFPSMTIGQVEEKIRTLEKILKSAVPARVEQVKPNIYRLVRG